MDLISLTSQNLVSPVILFFLLGIMAGLLNSSLTIPEALSKSISLYLMMAIGFRGGVELSHSGLGGSVVGALGLAVALSAGLPFIAYALLRKTTKLNTVNAAAVSAHYGSVSVVTFAAAISVLNHQSEHFEPYIVALLAAMEAPAILTGLFLAHRKAVVSHEKGRMQSILKTMSREVLLHGSVFLLLGSFIIGWLTGPKGLEQLSPIFVKPFYGILAVFLMDIGLLVAKKFRDIRTLNPATILFGLYMPAIGAFLGIGVALVLGLSAGGATLFAVLGASSSYIVVPAVIRDALPEASPAIYMTLSLGITFPFNLVVGIPVYYAIVRSILS